MKRFLFILVVLLAIGGFGMYRGWFGASTADASGKKGLVLTWDMEKFKADLGKAGSKIKSMSQTVVDKVKGKAKKVSEDVSELSGKVSSVDAANHTVTIDSDGQTMTLDLPEATAGIEQLVGKNVRVTLHKVGDTLVVTKVEEN